MFIGIFNSICILVSSKSLKSQKLIQQLAFPFWVPHQSGNHISSNKSMKVLRSSMLRVITQRRYIKEASLRRYPRSGYRSLVSGYLNSSPVLCALWRDCIFYSLCSFEVDTDPWPFPLSIFRNFNYRILKRDFIKYRGDMQHFSEVQIIILELCQMSPLCW